MNAALAPYYTRKCTTRCEHTPPPQGPLAILFLPVLPAVSSNSCPRRWNPAPCSGHQHAPARSSGPAPGLRPAYWDLPCGLIPTSAALEQRPAAAVRRSLDSCPDSCPPFPFGSTVVTAHSWFHFPLFQLVTRGQQWSKNTKWSIPEVNNSSILNRVPC